MKRNTSRMLRRALFLLLLMLVVANGPPALATGPGNAKTSIDGYVMTFSDELTEGVAWKPLEETPQIDAVFSISPRDGVEVPLFTMTLQEEQGDHVLILTDETGTSVPVSFTLADRPAGLTDEEKWAFTWAQADAYLLMETLTLIGTPGSATGPISVETEQYEITLDTRWQDAVRIVQEADGSVSFLAVIGGKSFRVFRLVYDDSGGQYVITRMDEDGSRVNISFYIEAAPPGLDDQARKTFYSVQSLVNEAAENLTLR